MRVCSYGASVMFTDGIMMIARLCKVDVMNKLCDGGVLCIVRLRVHKRGYGSTVAAFSAILQPFVQSGFRSVVLWFPVWLCLLVL